MAQLNQSQARRHSAGESMSPGQRRALFAAARSRGMDRDDLRAMTPCGSISLLTRDQASALLNRLNRDRAGESPRRYQRPSRLEPGVYRFVTEAQVRKVDALRIDLGWAPERLKEFLSDRHYADGRPMATAERCPAMDTSSDGIQVIELLKSVSDKADRAARRRGKGAAGR